jgi:hypothetical protein
MVRTTTGLDEASAMGAKDVRIAALDLLDADGDDHVRQPLGR